MFAARKLYVSMAAQNCPSFLHVPPAAALLLPAAVAPLPPFLPPAAFAKKPRDRKQVREERKEFQGGGGVHGCTPQKDRRKGGGGGGIRRRRGQLGCAPRERGVGAYSAVGFGFEGKRRGFVFLTGSLILLIGNHVAITSKQCFCRQASIYMDGKWKCFTCQLGSPSKEDKRWPLSVFANFIKCNNVQQH